MMEKLIVRRKRAEFNGYTRKQQIYDYLSEEFNIQPQPIVVPENIVCQYDETNYRKRRYDLDIEENKRAASEYSSENSLGQFFLEKAAGDIDRDVICDGGGIFTDSNLFDII